MPTHIDFEAFEARVDDLAAEFASAKPFSVVTLDGLLNPQSLRLLLEAIQPPELTKRSNDYFFAKNKFENPQFSDQGGILAEIKAEMLSARFAALLSTIYGKTVFVDPEFVGGGIHQGGAGSFLDMHADFNRHPAENEWLRELNILLYLNDNYEESYGGHLDLEHAVTHDKASIAPLLNRLVIMLTKEHTLHGYKPIRFPEGTYRTALAGYAYSVDRDFAATPARSTQWRPETGPAYKRMWAKISPVAVLIKNSLMGSNTVRRAKAKVKTSAD